MANVHAVREAKRLVSFSTPPPRQNNGADGLTTRLRRAILAGQYTFKERLPSERQLAEHFNASRGTVRKVLQRLTTMNLVEQRAGSGTYVRYGEFADRIDIADVTSPLELIDVRSGIELQIVRLAVNDVITILSGLPRPTASFTWPLPNLPTIHCWFGFTSSSMKSAVMPNGVQ
jgi:DNA-binding transcriptional regulator YhcF (GntR family)